MNMKKFVAASSRDALRMVRTELGADAVILSHRKLANGIELIALPHADIAHLEANDGKPANVTKRTIAKPSAAPPAVARQITPAAPLNVVDRAVVERTQQGILNEIKSLRDLVQDQMACMFWSETQQRSPRKASVFRSLLNAGFSPALLRNLLSKMPDGADIAWASQVLRQNLRLSAKENSVVVRGGVYALVGPTGVGKTTTTAKLAARAVIRHGAERVALITTDSYRIGAYEQLKIYSKILGVSVYATRDTDDLRRTLASLQNKYLVLIDTMGMGQRDGRVAAQTEMLNQAGVKRLLLLNAAGGGDTLDDVVRLYGGPGTLGCIITKLDEAVKLGTILDVVLRHKLIIHFIANGQRVPEDLHEANIDYLVHRTVTSARHSTAFSANEAEFPVVMGGGKVAEGQSAYAI
jgi:flagellar biosynthesis protein FlhF